ncbi:hypothetical protein TanjilG_30718 [Lupinus angustifolius]|uniref:Uncharacterized protein n=1 Tax=Lupinus angustifolius TaxID=3871 RepID=A0A4P1RPG9_LUPAN|nr:hypothetical protein TanjilG_30718 [Lupinus angustifolius]
MQTSKHGCPRRNQGNYVGLDRNADNGSILVRDHGVHGPIRVHASTLDRVTNGLEAGDWVHVKEEDRNHSPVSILHSVNRDGRVTVGFIGLQTFWKGNSSELEMAESYCVGLFVRRKANVLSPQFEWPRKRGGTWGLLIFGDEPNMFLADPSEADAVNFSSCPKMIGKYQHVEDHHWTVRLVLIASGFLTVVKFRMLIGKKMERKVNPIAFDNESKYSDYQEGWKSYMDFFSS